MATVINWNNTVNYIKAQLGAQVNQLEIDEYDIVNIIETITMPEFCSYVNYEDFIYGDKLVEDASYQVRPSALIKDYDRQIFEIKDVYFPRYVVASFQIPYAASDTIEFAIDNYASSIPKSMVPIRNWEFIRPNRILFNFPGLASVPDISKIIVRVGAAFKNPNEIEPSMYKQFRKLAAADTIDYIISLRTKYQNLTTPQGQINMDLSRLEQKATQLRQEAISVLEEQTIPDHYLWWVNP